VSCLPPSCCLPPQRATQQQPPAPPAPSQALPRLPARCFQLPAVPAGLQEQQGGPAAPRGPHCSLPQPQEGALRRGRWVGWVCAWVGCGKTAGGRAGWPTVWVRPRLLDQTLITPDPPCASAWTAMVCLPACKSSARPTACLPALPCSASARGPLSTWPRCWSTWLPRCWSWRQRRPRQQEDPHHPPPHPAGGAQ
jgi:hypothetical protein